MKNNRRKTFAIAVFALLITCAANVFGQIKTGGYKAVSEKDAEVKAAADFAVYEKAAELEEELSLEAVTKAERQIVQGTNYRLWLRLYAPSGEDGEDGLLMPLAGAGRGAGCRVESGREAGAAGASSAMTMPPNSSSYSLSLSGFAEPM